MPENVKLGDLNGCHDMRKALLGQWMDDLPEEWSPKDIEQTLHQYGHIVGQENAVRAASIITYNHFEGRSSVSLFVGPSGCGKTEIWRAIQREYGSSNIAIHDAATLTAEVWKGGTKISTIFRAIPSENRSRIILVLDEIDKLLEPQYASGGSNVSDLMQNQLLRMCDHDTLFFGDGDGGKSIKVDCSQVSVVMLGAFSRLLEGKSKRSGSIGFGVALRHTCDYSNTEITEEDLIEYGMRAELAGRINRIVSLEPLNADQITRIGDEEIYRLMHKLQHPIEMEPSLMSALAQKAYNKRLGARWLKSQINNMLDDLIYEDPLAEEYRIGYETSSSDIHYGASL